MEYKNELEALAWDFLHSYTGQAVNLEIHKDQFGQQKVDTALKTLDLAGAVKLDFKASAPVVTALDYSVLWQHSGLGTVMVMMPLPLYRRFEGLATGLHWAFDKAGIPFRLGFLRGATNRVEALLEDRCDLIVASQMTGRLDLEMGHPLSFVHIFGFKSFVKEYVVVFRDPRNRSILPGMRVALDPVAIDQTVLTSYECQGLEVEFVEIPYVQTMEALQDGKVDAVVWALDVVEEQNWGFNVQPLRDNSPRRVAGEDAVAVLMTSRDKGMLGSLLAYLLDFKGITAIQRQVLAGERKPKY